MLSGKGNKNGKKTTIGLISKKATLHVQHTFIVHFFAIVLHDCYVKLSETSWLHSLWMECRTCSCSLFFHCHSFSPWWPLTSHCYKSSYCSSNRKCLLLFFLSRSGSFLVEIRRPVTLHSVFLCFLYIPNL